MADADDGDGPGDHPRSRGVYIWLSAPVIESVGSSPLARGLPNASSGPHTGARIIPARAGFTPTEGSTPVGSGDHPRSRGVYTCFSIARMRSAGSSPLARGLHLRILGIPTTSDPTRLRLPSLPT